MSFFKPRARSAKPKAPVIRPLEIDGRTLPLTIRQNERATRLTLRIEPGGRALKLTVPRGVPEREVDAFLERHRPWLATKLARFSGEPTIEIGGSILIRGVSHRIEHTGLLRGLTRTAVDRDGESVLRVSGGEDHVGRRISDFLKKEARRDLELRVAVHAKAVGRKVTSISMKDTRSRWGSCTTKGALSFSWRIVMAPPKVLDYLAAHECAHLKEMNHGPDFWALCEQLCPQTADAKHWLKRNGTMLHAIDFT